MWTLKEALDYYRDAGAPSQQSALVELLREIQAEEGLISDAALQAVCTAYGLRETFLNAIIARYPSLKTEQIRHRLVVCCGKSCGGRGSAKLLELLERNWGIVSGQTVNGITCRTVPCLKHCGRGPNIQWDGTVYEGADEALLLQLLD